VTIPKTWIGKTVGKIDIRKRYNINIMALKRNGKLYPDISPDTILDETNTMMVLGEYSNIQKCFHI
ncbi:MAG: TrkA C-terminal domain-containing protein, partial [Ruminococcus sp.]|nr:TrkA C-terminal domain-containing protein [Ruminococcus sp.]